MTDTAGSKLRPHGPAGALEPRSTPDERAAAAHLPICAIHKCPMESVSHQTDKRRLRVHPLRRCPICVGMASAKVFLARVLSRPRYADLTEKRREQKAMQRSRERKSSHDAS